MRVKGFGAARRRRERIVEGESRGRRKNTEREEECELRCNA